MAAKKNSSSESQLEMKSSEIMKVPAKPSLSKTDFKKKGPQTRIVVHYDTGFNNKLTLRGKGASLNWDRGVELKNIKNDEWLWETDALFSACEFKVLINDHHYEIGENHPLNCGSTIQYTPKF